MKKQDFSDMYRDMHLTSQKYTWSNEEAATRIDYIWVSKGLASRLQKAEIEEVEEITESDHKIIVAEMWIKHLIAKNSEAKVKKKKQSRLVYLYDQAKTEDCESMLESYKNN